MANLYDEVPYESFPIEWTAPEWLALVSLFHGGPRPRRSGYRMLELGCGDAANLLPLAAYRPDSEFTGLDGSERLIATALADCERSQIANLRLHHLDFRDARESLHGEYDYIVLHGVFSWVDDATRDGLLRLIRDKLSPSGIAYISYNTRPGWDIRGLVRNFVVAQTAHCTGLAERVAQGQAIAKDLLTLLEGTDHPYSQLLHNELSFFSEQRQSYIAHEYFAPVNRAYWQSEFRGLLAQSGLRYLADADFNLSRGRAPEGLHSWLSERKIKGQTLEDTMDLICFRQFQCALVHRADAPLRTFDLNELAELQVAANLSWDSEAGALKHVESNYTIRADHAELRDMLIAAGKAWPRARTLEGLPLDEVGDDLVLLHRTGLIELSLPTASLPLRADVQAAELARRGEYTTPAHKRRCAGS